MHRLSSLGAGCAAGLAALGPAIALAQDAGDRSTTFRTVGGAVHEDVPGGSLLIAAYAAVLFLLALYVLYLTTLQRSAAKELTRLEAVLEKRKAEAPKGAEKD